MYIAYINISKDNVRVGFLRNFNGEKIICFFPKKLIDDLSFPLEQLSYHLLVLINFPLFEYTINYLNIPINDRRLLQLKVT